MPIPNMTGGEGMPYNLVNITGESGNILEFVQNINDLTGQTFMLGMLLVGFVILFVSMRESGNKEAFVGSGFITAVLGIFFFALEFISAGILTIIIIVFGGIFIWIALNKD